MARVEPWISISKLGLEEQFQNGSWFKRQIVSLRCHFIWDISKSSPFQFSIPARSSSVRSHWGPFRTSAKLISHFCETGFPTFANISTTNPNYWQAIEICGIQFQCKYKYQNGHLLPPGQWYAPSAVNYSAYSAYPALSCTMLHYVALSCTMWHYLALSCTILHYLAHK